MTISKHITTCPYCEALHDSHASPEDSTARPEPGDISMCIYCGNAGMFEEKNGVLGIRVLTDEELEDARADPILTWALDFYKEK